MSVRTLGTLGAVRDQQAPKKGDIGKGVGDPEEAQAPTLGDLLVTIVPTELVAPYTLAAGVIVGLIDKPTAQTPNPDEFAVWRWLLFIALLLITAAYVAVDKMKKQPRRRFPLPEVSGAVVAAAGWALVLPMSPLEPHLSGKQPALASAVFAFIALGIGAVIAQALKAPASQ
jgi:hypothetical protein